MRKETPVPIKTPSLVHVPTKDLAEPLRREVERIELKYHNRIKKLKRIKSENKTSK